MGKNYIPLRINNQNGYDYMSKSQKDKLQKIYRGRLKFRRL